ncbi:MAG: polymer-forming cytoskeletal protein [bacterium]
MLGKKDSEDFNTSGNLNTIIGKGSSFEGTLKVQSTVRIDGKVKGKVTASDSLVIGKEGVIDGEVNVRNAIIGGKLTGKLSAAGKVVLEPKSYFNGELKTSKLVIDEGAVFEGTCSMGDNKQFESRPEMPKGNVGFSEKKDEGKEVKLAK